MIRRFFLTAGFLILAIAQASAANYYNIPAVSSITQLRGLNPAQYPTVYLTQYNATTGLGAGEFTATGTGSCADNNGTLIQASGDCYARLTNGQPYNVAWFGAACNGIIVTDGVSTTGGSATTISSASALWGSVTAGEQIVVNSAAASNRQLVTTVSSKTSSSALVMSTGASSANTAETVVVYTDDTTALNNTFTAAAAAGVAVTLPTGKICGYANPGSSTIVGLGFPALYLNSGMIFEGQTGTVADSGIALEPTVNGFTLVGPGTINGGYQTNSGIAQSGTTSAIQFQNGANPIINAGINGNVLVENSKADCVYFSKPQDIRITDLTIQNCGDFAYVPGSGDQFVGRQFGLVLNGPLDSNQIENFHAATIAQSAIFITTSTATSQVALTNIRCRAAAYYCIDSETNAGNVSISNITIDESGTTGRSFVYGGLFFYGTANVNVANGTLYSANSNSISLESDTGSNNNQQNWSLSNVVALSGSPSTNPGSVSVSMRNNGGVEKTHLSHVVADNLTVVLQNGPACIAANPMAYSLVMEDVQISGLFGDGSTKFGTDFLPDGLAHEFLYLKATDSAFGYMNINGGVATNMNEILFDMPNDFVNGAVTFVGGAPWTTYNTGPTTITQPITSFSCPAGTT